MTAPKAVEIFEYEIQQFQNEDFKAFVHNALVDSPKSFYEDEKVVQHTKKTFFLVDEMLKADEVQGTIRDTILAGTLLSDIAINEMPNHMKNLHPFAGRVYLDKAKKDIQINLFEGVCRIIEAHEGDQTPSTVLKPKPGTPEHLVALANRIARLETIEIKTR